MATKAKKHMLPWYTKTLYASGSMSLGIMQHTVSGLIMFFGMAAHNMPGWIMGLICAAAMLVAAVMDPIAGNVSDNTQSRLFGQRYIYIILGIILISVINVVIWQLPASFPIWAKFIYLFFGVIALEIFNSFIQAPYNKLGSELAGSRLEQDTIGKYRYFFGIFGFIIPVILLGIFLHDKTNVLEYRNMAFISSTIMLLLGAAIFFGTYHYIPRLNAKAMQKSEKIEKKTIAGIFKEFSASLKVKNLREFLLGYAAGFMSIAFLTTIGLFFFQYTMGFSFQKIAGLISIVFAIVLVGEPIWTKAAKKRDKRSMLLAAVSSMMLGVILMAVFFILFYYGNKPVFGTFWIFVPGMVFIGTGTAGVLSLPRMMLDDFLVSNTEIIKKTDLGTFTFTYKLATCLCALITGVLLDIFKFSSLSAAQGNMPQYTYAALGWILIATLLITTLFSLIMYSIYRTPGGKSLDKD